LTRGAKPGQGRIEPSPEPGQQRPGPDGQAFFFLQTNQLHPFGSSSLGGFS